MADFKTGDIVTFRPGPNSKADVKAKVTAVEDKFLVTEDTTTQKVRRTRPGACKKAA
jgi:hypothetical protein